VVRRRGSPILLPLLLLTLAAGSAAGQPGLPPAALNLKTPGPFPGQPLATDPAALAAAVAALPPPAEAPAQMIFQESRFDFDAAGRITYHRHWIYRILRAEGLRDWGVSQVRYSPWHQERPRARVRVIDPDLRERRFDGAAYSEKPASEGRDDLFGERRVLELKLPVAVGSIVEEELTVADAAPYFAAGTTLRHYAALYIPVFRGRLVLESPTRLPLRYGLRLMPGLEPRKTLANGRVRLEFDYASMDAAGAVEVGIPGHRPRFPHVAFSSGRDWQSVAGLYHREVEAALAVASLADWPRPPAQLGRREKAAFLLAALQSRVRASGLELGAGPPAPKPPDQVARDGRGDGKDIATLMLALLRKNGVDGRLVLLSSGFGPDSESKLPGLGLFNHALVLLPALELQGGGAEPAIWLDPSAPFVRAGELPLPAQGRFSLVADPASSELELTPTTRPYDNRTEETREVFFADYGLGRVVEKSEHWGSADRNQRQVTEGLEPAVRRRGYQAYVQVMHGASALGEMKETPPADLSGPFTLTVEALGAAKVKTDFDQATLEIPRRELLRRLPNVFLLDKLDPRQEEFIFHEPFATYWHYVVHLPPGFSAGELPPPSELSLGPAKLKSSFRAEGELVRGELSLDVGQRLISAHQFEELRRAALELSKAPDPLLVFPHRGQQLFASGDRRQAIAQLRAAVAAEPQRVSQRVRLARGLLELGFPLEAQRQAREATRLAPGWGAAHFVLGRALGYDELGRRFSPFAELEAARSALQKAAELDPADSRIAQELAELKAAQESLAALAAPRPELHPDDPQTPLKKLLLAHLGGEGEAMLALLHPRSRDLVDIASWRPLLRWIEGPPAADPLADWETRLALKASGAPHIGYRLSFGESGHRVYLSREAGTLKIVATSEDPALLGWEAIDRFAAGDPEGAQRWLDWAREDLAAQGGADPLGPKSWLELWKGLKEESEKTVAARSRLAAVTLAAPLDHAGRTLSNLLTIENPSLAIDVARAAARAAAGRFAELEEEAARLLARYPDSPRARAWQFAALRGQGDWDRLEKAAKARLEQKPDDAEALRALADWSARVGAVERSREPLLRLANTPAFTSQDGVHLILASLNTPGDQAAIAEAERLTERLEPTPELQAARAALAAEEGEGKKAEKLLREAADGRPLKAPRNEDAYVIGRLAESLGMADIARDAYQRLPPPGQASPFSFALLARQRLR
jgi:hypothetical protein